MFLALLGALASTAVNVIRDAFTRSDSSTLGTTPDGFTWNVLRGSWGIASNKASSSTAATSYALATVPLASADQTTSVSVSQGCGPAFWVTDANSWYATYSYSANATVSNCLGAATGNIYNTPQTCSCGTQTSQAVSNCAGPATGYIYSSPQTCTCGNQVSTYACSGPATGYVYSSSPTCTCGSVQSTTDCSGPATGYVYSSSPTCTCGTAQSTTSTNCNGAGTGLIYASSPTCTCGSVTSGTVYNCYIYRVGTTAYTSSTCTIDGGTWGGTSTGCCFNEIYYGCSATQQSTTTWRCSATQATKYQCSSTPVYSYGCSATAGSGTLYGCSATASSSTVTKFWLRVMSMLSGTTATLGSDVELPSAPAAISVNTNGITITSRAYSDVAMSTLIGTNTQTPSTPTRGTSTGFVKAESTLNQGSTVDDFVSSI